MSRFAVACLAGLALASPAAAEGPFDGSSPLVCAFTDSFECSGEAACAVGDADRVRIPDLVRIDFSAKSVTALDEERRGETTKIRQIERADGRLVLQGQEGGRGWTFVLSETTGNTTLSVADDGVAFVVFGECARPL